MKVYLASPWKMRDTMEETAEQFEAAGHTITERWWDHVDLDFTKARNLNALEDQATKDYLGVLMADVLVVLNPMPSEGKAVETGIAIASVKPVILIGKRTNIFHFMPNVQVVATVRAAIRKLEA